MSKDMHNARSVHADNLEARYGLRVAARLHEQSMALPHDVEERLRVARQQALERARLARASAAVAGRSGGARQAQRTVVAAGGPSLGDRPSWWGRLGAALPFVLLLAGLVLIQHLHSRSQIDAAADVDAALLADDLPPSAYGDAGFVEFLRSQPQE